MPLAFRPDRTVDIWLNGDSDLPPDKRPVFLARYMSEADAQRMEETAKLQEQSDDTTCAHLREAIAIAVTGWRNFPSPYQGAESLKCLTAGELLELLHKTWRETTSVAPFAKPSTSP